MKAEEDEDEDVTIGVTRYPCLPSLVALQQMRNRLHMAQVGKRLMKWTAMATGRELRNVARQIQIVYRDYAEDVRNAYMLLARCRYFFPNLNNNVLNNIGNEAAVTVTTTPKGLTGVKVMEFEIQESGVDNYVYLGLERGGQTIDETKELWLSILKRSVQILQLRTSFNLVDIAHKSATKRSNVMSKLVIPRTEATIKYIISELEEMAREEFFRLKKIIDIKNRAKKKPKTCAICHKSLQVTSPESSRDKIVDEEKLDEYKTQLEAIVSMTEEYKKEGILPDKADDFLKKATEWREKLGYDPEPVEGVADRDEARNVTFQDNDLGIFETDIQHITRTVRSRGKDGKLIEEKQVIVIKREVKHPPRQKPTYLPADLSKKSEPYGENKTVQLAMVKNDLRSKSENMFEVKPMANALTRNCISSVSILSTDIDKQIYDNVININLNKDNILIDLKEYLNSAELKSLMDFFMTTYYSDEASTSKLNGEFKNQS